MSKKMKAYQILYRPDNANTDMNYVVVISVSKSEAIIDLVNADNVYWIESIRSYPEFEVDKRGDIFDKLNQKIEIIYHDR